MQVLFSLFSTYTENLPSPGTPTFFFFFFFCVNFFPGLNYLSPFVTHLSRGAQWESCVVTRPHVVVTPRRDEGAEEKREKIGRKNIHTRLFNRGTPRETFLSLLCSRTSSAGMLDRVTRGESWLRNFIPGNFRVLGEKLAFKARGSRYETLPSHRFFSHSFPSSPYLKALLPLRLRYAHASTSLLFFFRFVRVISTVDRGLNSSNDSKNLYSAITQSQGKKEDPFELPISQAYIV